MARSLRRALALVTAAVLAVGLMSVAPVDVAVAAGAATSPSLVSPAKDSETVGNPVFNWSAVAGASTYRFELSTSSTFATTGKLYGVDTYGLHATPPNDLPGGSLYWRVAAIAGTVVGAYTESGFTKVAAAGPVPSSPASGATLAYPQSAPLLKWSVLSGVSAYEVQLDDANDFLSAQSFKTANTALAISAPLTLNKAWHWRVRGISATTGVTTAWSVVRSFTISWGANGKPVLVSPANGAVNVQDIKFSWTGASLPAGASTGVPGAREYQLQVSPNNDWANNITEDVTVKGTQFSPEATYAASSYYWRVRAIATAPTKDVQYGPWSETSEFGRSWLDRPVLVPVGAEAYGEVDKDDFHFDWAGVAHAAYYELQVGTDENFNTSTTCSTLHTSLTPHAASKLPTGTIGANCLFEPLPGTRYYWKVRGVDTSQQPAKVYGVWSDTGDFLFDQDVVELRSPLNTSVTAPVLRWSPMSGYHKYEITLVKAAVAEIPAHDDVAAVPAVAAQTTIGTTYSTSWSPVDVDLKALGAGTYEWWVTAVSPGKVHTPWPFSGGHFQVTAPTTSTSFGALTTDFGGQPQDMPSMAWTPITNAQYYRVMYASAGSSTYLELTPGSTKVPQAAYTYAGNLALPVNHRETLPAGSWTWFVLAFDENNVKLATSSLATFTIAPSQFSSTSSHLPPNSTTALDVPELRWAPVVGTYEYRVHLALDVNFTNTVRTYTTTDTSLTPRESLEDNQAGQSYYWYVQVCKSPGSCGPLPESAARSNPETIWSFRKQSPAPKVISPKMPTVPDVRVPKLYDQVSFAWEDYFASDQRAPGAKVYSLEVATDSAFTDVIDTQIVDQAVYAPWAETYPDSVYYWRVQAVDGSGLALTRTSNTVGQFQKSSAQPSGLSSTVVSGLPTLTWSPLSHAGSYTVEIFRGKDATFPVTTNRVRTDITSYPAFTPDVALAAGDYSWRVRKNDVDGNPGTWAENAGVNFFTVVKPTVTLNSPTNETQLKSSDTVFTWTGVVGASAYRFETSTSDSFASPFELVKTVNNKWASAKYFADGTTYRWRVSALDGTGTVIGTSAVRTFTKNEVSITLSSTANPAKSHSSLTLTAAVTRPGKAVAGTVTFFDGSTKLGTGSVKANIATYATSAFTVGSHNLTASWAGDSSSAAVTSAVLRQNIAPAGATYTPVTPSRVMSFQKIGAGQTFTLALPMAPAGATAVALNVTAANPSSNTYVSVCPGGTATTTCKKASNVNPYYGKNTPNMVIVKLGTKHDVTFYNDAGTVQLIADVQGWFVDGVDSGATYQPIAPKRVMAFTPVAAGKMVTLTIKDPPSGASAVALNVTAANPTNDTYISTCPGGTAIGTCKLSSSLNPTRGTNTPNMVIVKLGTGGTVSFYNDSGSVQLIADVQGWFVDSRTAGASYVPVDPTRSMAFQKVGTGRTYNLTLTGVPTGATAVALNLTSANQTKDTYVSVCPYGTDLASCKAASNLNPYRGKDIANLVVVKLGTGNRITFYNDSGDSELIADVQGWFVS
ncbi:MAG: Ig-like domain repeat protein [Rhodoglobus sp.]